MLLTREILEKRKAELMADYHAISGAIQQVDWTLEKLDEEEPDEE